jgi:hypothetical protein
LQNLRAKHGEITLLRDASSRSHRVLLIVLVSSCPSSAYPILNFAAIFAGTEGKKSFRNFAEICVRLRIVAIGVFLSDFRRPLAHRDKPSGESDDVGLTRLRIASISDA